MNYPIKHSMLDENFLLKVKSGEVTEDVIVEFKIKPYQLGTRDEKKEFLRDVSAMLNASGGVILLGVSDDGELEGVSVPDFDLYKRQILSIISSNIEPQIIGIDFKKIEFDGRDFLSILVPNGELKPYSIKLTGGESREFVVRQNASNHHMSMSEIRRLFFKEELSKAKEENWKSWKKEKVDNIINDKWMKPLLTVTSILTLITPIDNNPDDNILDVAKLKSLGGNGLIWPPHSDGCTLVSFPSGVFAFGRENGVFGEKNKCFSYVVVEENLSFQYYDSLVLTSVKESLKIDQSIDEPIFNNIEKAFKFLDNAGFKNKKYQISVFFINVKGAKIFVRFTIPGAITSSVGIPSDICEFKTEISVGDDVLKEIRPIFDKLWQSSGLTRCSRYNENGDFIGGNISY